MSSGIAHKKLFQKDCKESASILSSTMDKDKECRHRRPNLHRLKYSKSRSHWHRLLNSFPLVFMSVTTASTSNFRLILDALDDYAKQTEIDLTKNPFTEALQTCDSPDSILQLLQNRAQAFKDYRDGNWKLINWLSPVVQVLHGFSPILSEAAGLVSSR
jgi:hypothetical protein